MNNLWYGSDEVNGFHPVVENCIKEALYRAGLSDKYIVKHHYGLFTQGIPDFSILDKRTEDFVCIIEVKKTPTDALGQDAGYQSMSYVKELCPIKWRVNYQPHFCVTNIEYTQFYCLRDNSSLIGCLLDDSPKYASSIESIDLAERFIEIMKDYLIRIDNLRPPVYSMHLESISESFNNSFYNISQILGANLSRINNFVSIGEDLRQSVLYELFRFAFYYYIKEYFLLNNNQLANYFNKFETSDLRSEELVNLIRQNFGKVMEIDFLDILKDYDSKKSIFPSKILASQELGEIFNNFILTLENNAHDGLVKNRNLLNYVSLITADIYDKKEMHATGKIMSDEILSDILSGFTIETGTDTVIDPCCGDGNLLTSAYKRKRALAETAGKKITHNDLLKNITGIEIDPNLIQLAAFKLIGQDLDNVTNQTRTNLFTSDLLTIDQVNKYNSVVMNPPYLRNEDLLIQDKEKWLTNIENITGNSSFIRNVSQPNLYYYFVELATEMLNINGKGAYILMSKFLNNKDGELLKKFLIPYLDAVIHYPPTFFVGFAVTTNIFILNGVNNPSSKISFLNVRNTDILNNIEMIKDIIHRKSDNITEDYSIINVAKESIDCRSNWRLYHIDPQNKFNKFSSMEGLASIKSIFSNINRGRAGNSGASANLFPESNDNSLHEVFTEIEDKYVGFGLLRNKTNGGRRKLILTPECLNFSKGLLLPEISKDSFNKYCLSELEPGIKKYLELLRNEIGESKFNQILPEAITSKVIPEILIPRGDRIKHSIYYYPYISQPVLLSTNFFSLSGLRKVNNGNNENNIKFIVAFLVSTFGQIQFEIHGNNQEGSRKIEKFIIEKLRVIDPNEIHKEQIDSVVREFEKLDSRNEDFLGIERNNPRDNLDEEICKILYTKNKLGFISVMKMKQYFQNFLNELVKNRMSI